jgi:2-hydroxychromene-2-carboxylate isomerase
LAGLSVHVQYRPVFLGALLQENGNPGPVGIAPKRVWTYRHAQWLGKQLGVPLQMPAAHPFNPVPLLRVALQTSRDGTINRYVAETVFRHVWQGGEDAVDAQRLQALHTALASHMRTDDAAPEQAKHWLRSNTQAASAQGVFGVPAFEFNGEVFWGLDSLPMLRSFIDGDDWFRSPGWENAKAIPSGLT